MSGRPLDREYNIRYQYEEGQNHGSDVDPIGNFGSLIESCKVLAKSSCVRSWSRTIGVHPVCVRAWHTASGIQFLDWHAYSSRDH